MKSKVCYNCGTKLTKENETKEHIPAKNLFEGFDEKYKVNRITVSACLKCNGKYSPTDEEFRNMMGIISKKDEDKKITEKSVRSVLSKDKGHDRLHFDELGMVSGVTFSQGTIEEFHIKNFRGLFMYEYGNVVPDAYQIIVNIDENDWSQRTRVILGFFELFDWKHSGHPDIFQYKLQPFRVGIKEHDRTDLIPVENEPMYACLMKCNNQHVALVIGIYKKKIKSAVMENPDISGKRDLISKYKHQLKSSSEQSLNIPSEFEDDFWTWFEEKSRIYYGKRIRKTLRATSIQIKPDNFCFKNCFRIAKGFVKRLFYFEGFSFKEKDSNCLRHAFNVCKNDRVSDYSLSDKPEKKQDFYVGVKIPLTFARKIYGINGDAKFTQYSLLVSYYLHQKRIGSFNEYAHL